MISLCRILQYFSLWYIIEVTITTVPSNKTLLNLLFFIGGQWSMKQTDNGIEKKHREIMQKAFKKLKSNVYFDKTASILRNDIVKFETNNELDETLNGLYEALYGEKADFDNICNEIIDSINYHALPKSISETDTDKEEKKNEETIFFNGSPKQTNIKELQYIIDMDVRGHILGVVWLMLIGCKIDKECIYKHSYGNRIRKILLNKINEEPTYSPYLFEPYFHQYESWRDKGLNIAKQCLSRENDVVIITLDFKRFFYSVDMDNKAFEQILRDIGIEPEKLPKEDSQCIGNSNHEDIIIYRLNSFVCKVIEKYSKLFPEEAFEKRHILPIGFLPSNVLSNWCLRNFDKAISDGWNPLYYGRYVDDILIVDKIEHNSGLFKRIEEGRLKKKEIIDYLLQQCSRWNGIEPNDSEKCTQYAPFIDNGIINNSNTDNEIVYHVNPLYNPVVGDEKSDITLQNRKLKVFYFKSGETDALITCFKKAISKNKSEFRYLPEADVFSNDYSSIYDLQYEDTINKFRGLNKMDIDPFKLSKYLGKKLKVGSMVDDKKESDFAKDIIKIFDHWTVIKSHNQWERIFEILLIDSQYVPLKSFIARINDAIRNISIEKIDANFSSTKKEKVQQTLYLELDSALCRAFSLAYGKKTDKILDYIYKFETSNSEKGLDLWKQIQSTIPDIDDPVSYTDNMRIAYNKTRMSDKSVLPIPIALLKLEREEGRNTYKTINLSDFKEAYDHLNRETPLDKLVLGNNSKPNYIYFPYLISMHEIALTYALFEINKDKPFETYQEIANNQKNYFCKLNYNLSLEENDLLNEEKDYLFSIEEKQYNKYENAPKIFKVSVGNESLKKMKIAIANAKLHLDDFEKWVKGKPNRSYQRYHDVVNIINHAIKEKADILVMPESYLPFEWLAPIARTCAENQLAVVTGVEHFAIESYSDKTNNYPRKVFNFTAVILPYIDQNRKSSYISFHLKRHYAPFEISQIRGYGYKEVEGSNYELYKWKGCYFPIYCCYELASISERALFQAYADFIIAVEWNHDTKYYSNIMESLSRDVHCYCVQVNTSDYGDSRIIKPSKSEMMNILQTKGGLNRTVLIGEIDVEKLRDFQIKEYELQKDDKNFKTTPPEFDKTIVMKKIKGIPL